MMLWSVQKTYFLNTVHLPGYDIQGLSRYLRYKMGGRGREITAVKVLDYPVPSSDLTPSDFQLLLHLKKCLAGQKFHKGEEV